MPGAVVAAGEAGPGPTPGRDIGFSRSRGPRARRLRRKRPRIEDRLRGSVAMELTPRIIAFLTIALVTRPPVTLALIGARTAATRR